MTRSQLQRASPKNADVEDAMIRIIRRRGGAIQITTSDWNIYDEVARELNITAEERHKLTKNGRIAWIARIGYTRQRLVNQRKLAKTSKSGRGVWQLAE